MNLVIGNTSQLAHYFPDNYEKISSRNIDLDHYKNKFYDRIFFCFGENRTYLENEDIFFKINVDYTLGLAKFFEHRCNKLIIFGTSELWNNHEGPIDIHTPMVYNFSPYVESKRKMIDVLRNTLKRNNVIIIHPFNFNSIYRKGNFLFGKVFYSILNKERIEIGDTNFYRDIVHPKYVANASIECEKDELIGSGRLTYVNDFIKDLYKHCGLSYEDYVTENSVHNLKMKRKIFYHKDLLHQPHVLLEDTLNDLPKHITGHK